MTADAPAYFNGTFMPVSQVKVSPLDRGFLFGDGMYEVIPAFDRHFLDLEGHLERLDRCLQAIKIPNPHSIAEWRDICQHLIDADDATDTKVYVQVTRGVQSVRNHDFSGDESATVFAMCNAQSLPDPASIENGISLFTEEEIRWSNCHLKSTSLLANVLLKNASSVKGGAETLVVNSGRVVEGSSSNAFAVFDGEVHTPPNGKEILPGITRNLVIQLARDCGIHVVETELPLAEVLRADEVWISSSTRGVLAATRINNEPVGNGVPGPVWRRVHERYQAMVDELRSGG
ncbi:MAG: aminotransferase class IV [Pseudomonadota bacterium]